MPRKPNVSKEDAVALVEAFISHFKTPQLPAYSDNVWTAMSKAVGGKWNPHNVYCTVTQNRNDILTKARHNKGIFLEEIERDQKNDTVNSTLDETLLNDEIEDPYEFEEKARGLDIFSLEISREEWNEMMGPPITYGDGKIYSVLHREKWTGMLSIIIFQRTHLPCAYVFDNSKIYNSADSLHYCRITGRCKSKECGNRIFCYVDKPPGDAGTFVMTMRTRDTFWDTHEVIKRDLRGYWRQQVGENVYYMGAGNFQKEAAVKDTKFGGRVGPNVPEMAILRRAKSDFVSRKYDLKPGDGEDVVHTIEKMRYSEPYNKFIHEVKRDKFYVSFSAYNQMLAYKQYCRLKKGDAIIGIDGTGSLIKKFRRLDGTKTSHIFLYSVTINQNERTISVHEALTESQETDILAWWLAHWLRMGAPTPGQVFCDRSRALMNAVSQAFNNITVKVYVEILFLRALHGSNSGYHPPIYCYLRNDVAHLMIAVAKWDTFKKIPFSTVRQFYLYCLGLLIEAQNLEQFKEFLQLIFTIGLHKTEDDVIRVIEGGTVADCRKKLEGYIARRDFPFDGQGVEDYANASKIGEVEESVPDQESPIKNWVDNLRIMAEFPKDKCEIETGTLNVYYVKGFISRLIELIYEFPVWSAAAIPATVSRSSTAFTEGFFNDLKNRVLKNHGAASRADVFLKKMFTNNCGGAELFSTDMKGRRGTSSRPGDHGKVSVLRTDHNTNDHAKPASIISNDNSSDGDDSEKDTSDEENIPPAHSNYASTSGSGTTPSLHSWDHESTGIVPTTATNRDYVLPEPTSGIQNPKENIKRKHCHTQESNPEHTRDKAVSPISKKSKMSLTEETHQSPVDIRHDNRKKIVTNGEGKYFKPRPDLLHRDGLATNIRKCGLLINGNTKKGKVSIAGKIHYSSNTCGFDSIVQILTAALLNDERLKQVAMKSTNGTLQFTLEFIKNGSHAKIYQERTKLLQMLFPHKIVLHYPDSKILASYEIEMYDHIVNIWKGCFAAEPCVIYQNSCWNCGTYESSKSTLTVDHDLIDANPNISYRDLQRALQFNFCSEIVTCTRINDKTAEPCYGNVMVRPKAIGDFIFIELDIPNRNDGTVVECQLAVMPKSLDLLDAQFRLAGMISSSTSHHTSYCWRPNNNWEFCDNRASSVAFAGQRTKIKASAAIYVKILPNDEHEPKKNVIHAENQFQSSPRLSATPPRISVISCTSSPPTIDLESPHNSGKLNQSCLLPQYKHSEDLRTTKRDSDTFSRDNWRNKGSPDLYWVEETDESTLIINDDGESFLNIPSKTETAEGYTNRILSPSGTMPDANEVNENSLCLTNTSIVDSITHILLIAALDDPHYLQSIEGSPDKLLRFIVSLKDQSLNDAIHADKTDLFMSLFSRKIQLSENGMCILDPHDSVSNLWEEALLNAPSVYKFFECQTCGPYVVPVWTINIDCELIYRQNFSVLQQALKFYPTLKKVPCIFEGCEQLCSIKCSANFHIFIDLEMKIRGRSQKTVQCKLGEIPKTLHLDMEYRLAGVIAHAEAGFVAYCYRVNESTARWELYGSCPKKNHPADPHDVVEPHGAIYLINYSFSGE